jgi:hypothetical protein
MLRFAQAKSSSVTQLLVQLGKNEAGIPAFLSTPAVLVR